MALTIDVERVSAVLLGDGWHILQPGTFGIDDYTFSVPEDGGVETAPTRGFSFSKVDQLTRDIQHFVGPLSYLLAVRYEVPTEIFDDD